MTMIGGALLILLVLVLVKEKPICAQSPTAVITPRGYNASLDPEANFTFQCDVTGADGVQWLVDSVPSTRQDVRNRGISESDVIVVDEATGGFRAYLSVTRSVTNRNTTIICIAQKILSAGIPSDPVLFQVQGLLDAPSNLMLSEANDQHTIRLSWNKPFSLDVEQDVNHYKVYYSVSAEKSRCTYTDQTELTFLYVCVPLNFTVSAINVVGEGEAMTIFHDSEANSCNNTGMYKYLAASSDSKPEILLFYIL